MNTSNLEFSDLGGILDACNAKGGLERGEENRMSEMPAVHQSQVAGSFLLGLVASFNHLNIVPDELQLEQIDQEQWYPYEKLTGAISLIEQKVRNSDIILFYAGINFIRIWYHNGPGRSMINSSVDWLYANKASGGYNSVVRGRDKIDTGWCLLQSIDEAAGIAVFENVMPLPPDFVRGVFYGGCLIFDDMEYVEVQSTSEPFLSNTLFNKFILTVRYKSKSEAVSKAIDTRIKKYGVNPEVPSDPAEIDLLIWRTKGMQVKLALEMEYHKAIGDLLADSLSVVRQSATELAKRNIEVEYFANHDSLTGLPTRRVAMDRLKMMHDIKERRQVLVAILFIDLDGFKDCNDRFGHDAGDHVLKMVAERLSTCLRRGDLVARMGGDEFLVFVSDEEKAGLQAIASKIIDAIAQPIPYRAETIRIGCSIGIAIADDTTNPEDLVKNADNAMYSVKAAGKNSFRFFE